jgi:hypothetical protein
VPNTGTVGSATTVTVSSSAFYLDGEYKIRWSSVATFDSELTVVLKEGVLSKVNSIVETVTIPEGKYGINYVQFLRYNRDDAVNFQYTVKPKLEIIPPQAPPGAKVTVKGTGFPADGGGAITFDGKATTLEIVPNKFGTFTAEFIVPATIVGDAHKFVASSPKIYTDSATAAFKVVPGITIEPTNPEVGADVKVTGFGFAAKSVIKLKYDNISISNSPTSDENGNFSHTFKVVESAIKDHKIIAEDGAGNSAVWGLRLEGTAPPKVTPISPKAERFGWLGDQTVSFNWTPVSDFSGVFYTIEVAEDLNFFPLKPGMKKVNLTQPGCTIDIKAGTYYWRVKAIDGAGNEGEWAISPYPFNVGFFSAWMLAAAGVICLLIFVLLLRAFFRRLKEYE